MKKKVYLVGAGPGDVGLLTIKGKAILERADVVVYDRLVGNRIIDMIPQNAEKINVGKNVGCHPVAQEQINQILLEKAKENKLVVRLKGGDPFVFGRGGEELELLAKHGIQFEIVPGITSAISAAAYAGIPVTHRDFCSSLHIITGHARKDGKLHIDYKSLVRLNGTLVFMMSVGSVKEIAEGLMNSGMPKSNAVAVVENGTRLNQRKFVGCLSDIGEIVLQNRVQSPAAIIVGEVCTLSSKFDWFNKSVLPLMGIRVLVTNPNSRASRMSDLLYQYGADAVVYPCIKTTAIDFDLNTLHDSPWICFTSAFGVERFFNRLEQAGLDSRCLYGKKIAVVGSQTANELSSHGIRPDFIPTVFDGIHLANELLEKQLAHGDKITLYRAKIGGNELPELLRKGGIIVNDVPIYDTEYTCDSKQGICTDEFDYITFTSASCVEGFARSNSSANFSEIKALCIGEQTAGAARKYGMQTLVSKCATMQSMIDTLISINSSV